MEIRKKMVLSCCEGIFTPRVMKSLGSEGERKGVRGVLVVVGVANVTYIIACKSLSCVQTVVMSRTNRSFLEDHAYSIS